MEITNNSVFRGKVLDYFKGVLTKKDIKKIEVDSYGDELQSVLQGKGIKCEEERLKGIECNYVYTLEDGNTFKIYHQDGDYYPSKTNKWNGTIVYRMLQKEFNATIDIKESLCKILDQLQGKELQVEFENREIHFRNWFNYDHIQFEHEFSGIIEIEGEPSFYFEKDDLQNFLIEEEKIIIVLKSTNVILHGTWENDFRLKLDF